LDTRDDHIAGVLIAFGLDDADVEGGALGHHRELLQGLVHQLVAVYENQRARVLLHHEVGKDHRLAGARGQTHHLALHAAEGRRLDRGEGVALIGPELDEGTRRSLLQSLC
jgi:hypothetical protein